MLHFFCLLVDFYMPCTYAVDQSILMDQQTCVEHACSCERIHGKFGDVQQKKGTGLVSEVASAMSLNGILASSICWRMNIGMSEEVSPFNDVEFIYTV